MAKEEVVEIRPLNIQVVEIEIIGDTELIVNAWDKKTIDQFEDQRTGKAAAPKKQVRIPEQEYQSSMYLFDDGRYGFPAVGFKAAIIGACRMFKGLPMTTAKITIRVNGEFSKQGQLVEIAASPHMRTDMVRLANGNPDIRYRAGFWPWTAKLPIAFNADVVSLEQLYNLVDAAGFGGIGEWRPSAPKSATGSHGCFHVARANL